MSYILGVTQIAWSNLQQRSQRDTKEKPFNIWGNIKFWNITIFKALYNPDDHTENQE